MKAEIIEKYFPQLTPEQQQQFAMLDGLYRDWNAKINVISRKDIDNLYEHHVLHSLAIAKMLHAQGDWNCVRWNVFSISYLYYSF